MTRPRLLALGASLMLALAAPAAAQERRPDAPLRVRPGQDRARPEHDRDRGERAQAAGRRLDHALHARTSCYEDGSVPRVDVIHLHHGVWLKNLQPLFAAGEEKTTFSAPPGHGWRYRTTDTWHMNHMIHNLTPTPDGGLHHLRPRLRARHAARRGRHAARSQTVWLDAVGSAPTRCSTPSAATAGSDRRLDLSRRGPRRAAQRAGRCRRTARSSAPRGTCTRAGCGPT